MGNKLPIVVRIIFWNVLMFPTVRSWDELALGERCILHQNVETRDLLLDLFTEGVDRRVARKVKEKEFNVVKLRRLLDFYINVLAPVPTTGEASERSTSDGLVSLGLVPTRDYQPFGVHGSEVFRGFEAESDVCPSDQHDLAGEVFGHEGYWTSPLFSQELEEGVLGHRALCVVRVVGSVVDLGPFHFILPSSSEFARHGRGWVTQSTSDAIY
jgi:hypothetical protein